MVEIFHILDIVKFKLNKILIKGIESVSQENYSDIVELKQKLNDINLITLSKLLGSFLEKFRLLEKTPVPIILRKDISVGILQMITMTRLFERIMTLESVKKTLKN